MKTKHNYFFLVVITFIVLTAISSCKKDDTSDDTAPITPAITVDSENQFSATINGINYNWKISTGASSYQSFNSSFSNDSSRYIYFSEIDKSSGTAAWEYFKIYKGTQNIPGTDYATAAQAKSFFAVGSYPFSNNALKGIQINFSYLDSSNIITYTSNNIAQTGSTFKIDGIKETFPDRLKIKASFSCNLKENSGNIVTLTNGIYVGEISYIGF